MSDLVNISDFSYERGLDLNKSNSSFTYLYGLADFWQYLFQDTTSTNLLLETTSIQASDIYSNFLQLCSGLSIKNIATSANSQLRLEIISTALNLPTNIQILSGTWSNNFTTIQINDTSNFIIGDTVEVRGVVNLTTYDIGDGIDFNPIDIGDITYTINGNNWNGIFIISNISLGGYITYYQPSNPGLFTNSGVISTINISMEEQGTYIPGQTYQLPENASSTRLIANKPFLPTIVLEEDVDYQIDPSSFRISFAAPLSSYGFPTRITSSGATEYSLWFVDVRYDEPLIYQTFPLLLGLTKPQLSNTDYRNFLYGLYYIYTTGPTLSVIEKGINLVLGIPLARDAETILEIRRYLNTNQLIVITDLNSYVVPAGLAPSVTIGQSLQVGDELSKWVEILDYQSNGDWWNDYEVEIPPELMPQTPTNLSRVVTGSISYPGVYRGRDINGFPIYYAPYEIESYSNWVMTNYLKNNTFLVKVNTTESEFLGLQQFESIPTLISELKPKHTYPLYSYLNLFNGFITKVTGTLSTGSIVITSTVGVPGINVSMTVGTMIGGHLLYSVATSSSVGIPVAQKAVTLTAVAGTWTPRTVTQGSLLTGISNTASISAIHTNSQPNFYRVETITSIGAVLRGNFPTAVSSTISTGNMVGKTNKLLPSITSNASVSTLGQFVGNILLGTNSITSLTSPLAGQPATPVSSAISVTNPSKTNIKGIGAVSSTTSISNIVGTQIIVGVSSTESVTTMTVSDTKNIPAISSTTSVSSIGVTGADNETLTAVSSTISVTTLGIAKTITANSSPTSVTSPVVSSTEAMPAVSSAISISNVVGTQIITGVSSAVSITTLAVSKIFNIAAVSDTTSISSVGVKGADNENIIAVSSSTSATSPSAGQLLAGISDSTSVTSLGISKAISITAVSSTISVFGVTASQLMNAVSSTISAISPVASNSKNISAVSSTTLATSPRAGQLLAAVSSTASVSSTGFVEGDTDRITAVSSAISVINPVAFNTENITAISGTTSVSSLGITGANKENITAVSSSISVTSPISINTESLVAVSSTASVSKVGIAQSITAVSSTTSVSSIGVKSADAETITSVSSSTSATSPSKSSVVSITAVSSTISVGTLAVNYGYVPNSISLAPISAGPVS